MRRLRSIILLNSILIASFPVHASNIESAWQHATLLENSEGDYLKLSGRLHIDSAWFEADEGEYSDLIWRRLRFGLTGHYQNITSVLEVDLDLNQPLNKSYNRITDAKLSYKINPHLEVAVLKQSAGFTLDGKTSSRKLYTPQRNNLTNNLWFTAEYFTGISAKGAFTGGPSYHAGVYSSDGSDEISISDASYFTLLAAAHHWGQQQIRLDYVYNDLKADSNTRDFSKVISLSGKFSADQWKIWTDFSYGEGDLGQADVFGFVMMPFYEQSESLQWVMRYSYLESKGDNGLRLGRYENSIVDERGDEYQEIYAGINYMFVSHKLKLQFGGQYAQMHDDARDGGVYEGVGITLALRSYW